MENKKELYPFGKYILEHHNIGEFGVNRFVPLGRGKINQDKLDPTLEDYKKAFSELYKLYVMGKKINRVVELTDSFPFCLLEKEEYLSLVNGCAAGISFCCIDMDGNVKFCPAFKNSLGNVFSNSLEEIWQDNKMLKEYRNLDWVPEPCSKCEYLYDCLCGCKASNSHMIDYLVLKYNTVRDVKKNNRMPLQITREKEETREEIKNTLKPSLLHDIKFREDLEGYLMYHTKAPLYSLNKIGHEILQKCDGENSIRDIANYQSRKYNMEYNIVEGDIKGFLRKLGNFVLYED